MARSPGLQLRGNDLNGIARKLQGTEDPSRTEYRTKMEQTPKLKLINRSTSKELACRSLPIAYDERAQTTLSDSEHK